MDEVHFRFKVEIAAVWTYPPQCNQTCSVFTFFKVNVMVISQLNLKICRDCSFFCNSLGVHILLYNVSIILKCLNLS